MCCRGVFSGLLLLCSLSFLLCSCLKDPDYNVSAKFIGKYKGIKTSNYCCSNGSYVTETIVDSNYIAEVIVFQKKGQIKINGNGYLLSGIDGDTYRYGYSAPQKFSYYSAYFRGDTLFMNHDTQQFPGSPWVDRYSYVGIKFN